MVGLNVIKADRVPPKTSFLGKEWGGLVDHYAKQTTSGLVDFLSDLSNTHPPKNWEKKA